MAKIPFKPGDYVVADESFNGRREGIVKVINGPTIGLQIIDEPDTGYIYYDYRDVKNPTEPLGPRKMRQAQANGR